MLITYLTMKQSDEALLVAVLVPWLLLVSSVHPSSRLSAGCTGSVDAIIPRDSASPFLSWFDS